MLHVVCRSIAGPEGDIPPGQLVDASKWRNTDALVNQRYLRPMTTDDTDVLGDTTVEVDEHGISNMNLLEPRPKPKAMKVRKKR